MFFVAELIIAIFIANYAVKLFTGRTAFSQLEYLIASVAGIFLAPMALQFALPEFYEIMPSIGSGIAGALIGCLGYKLYQDNFA